MHRVSPRYTYYLFIDDVAGYTMADPRDLPISFRNREAHPPYTAGFRFFSASFAFSCAVPDGLLSPSPLRDASMMRDGHLLYHLFMSPNVCFAHASVSHHGHYPILANSCFYNSRGTASHPAEETRHGQLLGSNLSVNQSNILQKGGNRAIKPKGVSRAAA